MRSRARESDAGIIITVSTCKYVFVVTPEVSHPRRGKRARRPRLRRHAVGCHGGGTLGGGSLLPESRFSALAHRGVSWPERKRVTRKRRAKYSPIRAPYRAEDNRARSRVNYPRARFAVGRDSTRQVSLCRGAEVYTIRVVANVIAEGVSRKKLKRASLVLKKREPSSKRQTFAASERIVVIIEESDWGTFNWGN